MDLRFLLDPTNTAFTIHGDPIDTDFLRLGASMSSVTAKRHSGCFEYERLVRREGFSQSSLAPGLRLEF